MKMICIMSEKNPVSNRFISGRAEASRPFRPLKLRFIFPAIIVSIGMLLCACSPSDGREPSHTSVQYADGQSSSVHESTAEERTETDTETEPPHIPAEREGWNLSGVPAYSDGKLDSKRYNCGSGMIARSRDSYMKVISQTSSSEFSDYLKELSLCGFSQEFRNEIDTNIFTCWYNGASRVYAYLIPKLRSATVILDNDSCSIRDFCSEPLQGNPGETVMYAYGIKGTGQLMLWHLADNRWILNDGGTNNVNKDELFRFLCEKSGISPEGKDKITIAMWYVSHAHQDHMDGAVALLNKYNSRINLERVMWNIPHSDVISTSGTRSTYSAAQLCLAKYYSDALYMKCHTGMEITIGEVRFRVLMTQEDNITKFVSGEYSDFNNTSTVCMTYFGGTSMFLPGDIKSGSLDSFVSRVYKRDTFCSPVIQVAHHGYNSMPNWYSLTLNSTEYAFYENSRAEGLSSGSGPDIYAKLGESRCFFTDKTWAMTVKDGQIVIKAE